MNVQEVMALLYMEKRLFPHEKSLSVSPEELAAIFRAQRCRFRPTCSQYAIDAFVEWGFFIGIGLTLWRILRCNPYSAGGYDPVPKRKKEKK